MNTPTPTPVTPYLVDLVDDHRTGPAPLERAALAVLDKYGSQTLVYIPLAILSTSYGIWGACSLNRVYEHIDGVLHISKTSCAIVDGPHYAQLAAGHLELPVFAADAPWTVTLITDVWQVVALLAADDAADDARMNARN